MGAFFKAAGRLPREHITPCEIVPEIFSYGEVGCRKIDIHSEIPVDDASQDMIYAIEVLEHIPRPYDFFQEARSKAYARRPPDLLGPQRSSPQVAAPVLVHRIR